MRKTYQVLANTIAVLVVVQAGAIAWAFFGLTNEIDQNGLVINKACLESDDGCGGGFTAEWGFAIHMFFNGMVLIPLTTLTLLIVSFFAKVPGGSKWAGFVLLDVVVQVALAFVSFGAPIVGILHGVNALFLAWLGWTAGHRVSTLETAERRHDEPALI